MEKNGKSSPEAAEQAQGQEQQISGSQRVKNLLEKVILVPKDPQEVFRDELETPRDSLLKVASCFP